MVECPRCQQQIEVLEQHKGTLFTCSHCNSVFFIDWDGNPEIPPPPDEVQFETAQAEQPAYEVAPQDPMGSWEAPPEQVLESAVPEQSFSSDTADSSAYAAPTEQAYEAPAEEAAYDFSRPLDEAINEPEVGSVTTTDTADFSDVTAFGNANTDTGQLTYVVRIQGIDSGKIYGQLREALTDSRFHWDVAEILKQIENGSLEVRGLNPAKTFVLVHRLKYLPLQISWRQDVLGSA